MALTQTYTAVPNDVITASRWNNEFGNIYNNGTLVAFPTTIDVSFAGKQITLDASGATTINSSASQGFAYSSGSKTGTPGTGANVGNAVSIASFTFTDSDTAGSGTAAEFSSVSIGTPTLVASNTLVTTTDASTFYIQGSPAASTNETITNPWAVWIDAGNVRVDGDCAISVNPYRFTATVAANALTITLQSPTGTTPSGIPLAFRNATIATPQLTTVLATAATTLVISSGSTLGTISAVASRIWIGALNNAGTIELFAYNALNMVALGSNPQAIIGPSIRGIAESDLITTTAEGGAGAADSSHVPYSTTARTAVAFRWLGYIESTQATAGTWATAPSKVQMMQPGIHFPGAIVQSFSNFDTRVATGTTAMPADNTIPLITEGDQYMSQNITPTFAGNVLHINGNFCVAHTATLQIGIALNDGTTVWAATCANPGAASQPTMAHLDYWHVANTVTATTWAIRIGANTGATTSFNGAAGTVRYTIMQSVLSIDEIQI